jgi:hypothetical protein
MPLVEQGLLTLSMFIPILSGDRVTQSLCVMLCRLLFVPLVHCVVCPLIYRFWYLHTLLVVIVTFYNIQLNYDTYQPIISPAVMAIRKCVGTVYVLTLFSMLPTKIKVNNNTILHCNFWSKTSHFNKKGYGCKWTWDTIQLYT